jgi:hypothetical protein
VYDYLSCPAVSPCRRAWRAPIMNAYAVIAGLSGLAVFFTVALKGFGQPR